MTVSIILNSCRSKPKMLRFSANKNCKVWIKILLFCWLFVQWVSLITSSDRLFYLLLEISKELYNLHALNKRLLILGDSEGDSSQQLRALILTGRYCAVPRVAVQSVELSSAPRFKVKRTWGHKKPVCVCDFKPQQIPTHKDAKICAL